MALDPFPLELVQWIRSSSIVANKEGSASSSTQLLMPYILHPLIGLPTARYFRSFQTVTCALLFTEAGA